MMKVVLIATISACLLGLLEAQQLPSGTGGVITNCRLFTNPTALQQCLSPELMNITSSKDFLSADKQKQKIICDAGVKWIACFKEVTRDCPADITSKFVGNMDVFNAQLAACCNASGPTKECGNDSPMGNSSSCQLISKGPDALRPCQSQDLMNITGPKDFLAASPEKQLLICNAGRRWAACFQNVTAGCPKEVADKFMIGMDMFNANFNACCGASKPSKECGLERSTDFPMDNSTCQLFTKGPEALRPCQSPELMNITSPKDFLTASREKQLLICSAGRKFAACFQSVTVGCPREVTEKFIGDMGMFSAQLNACCGEQGPSKECGMERPRDNPMGNSTCQLFNKGPEALRQCHSPEFMNMTSPKDFLTASREKQLLICSAGQRWAACFQNVTIGCPKEIAEYAVGSMSQFSKEMTACCGEQGPSKECGATWNDNPMGNSTCKLFSNGTEALHQCFSPELASINGPKDFLSADRAKQIQICNAGRKTIGCIKEVTKDCPPFIIEKLSGHMGIPEAEFNACCGEQGPSKECGMERPQDHPMCKPLESAMQRCSVPELANMTGAAYFLAADKAKQTLLCSAGRRFVACAREAAKNTSNECPVDMMEKFLGHMSMIEKEMGACCGEQGPSKECGAERPDDFPMGNSTCKLMVNGTAALQRCQVPEFKGLTSPKDFLNADRQRQMQICDGGRKWIACFRDLAKDCPRPLIEKLVGDMSMFDSQMNACCGEKGPTKECGQTKGDEGANCPVGGTKAVIEKCGPFDTSMPKRELDENEIQAICKQASAFVPCVREQATKCANEEAIKVAKNVADTMALCCGSNGPIAPCPVTRKCAITPNSRAALGRCGDLTTINFNQATSSNLPQVCKMAAQFVTCAKNITIGCSQEVASGVYGAMEILYRQCCLATGILASCPVKVITCTLRPCLNDGACDDKTGKIICRCKPGFTGATCETNINECASNPCSANAKCEDQANSYRCICPPGTSGARCEIAVKVCTKAVPENKRDELYCDYFYACENASKPPVRTRCGNPGGIQLYFEPKSGVCVSASVFKVKATADLVKQCFP